MKAARNNILECPCCFENVLIVKKGETYGPMICPHCKVGMTPVTKKHGYSNGRNYPVEYFENQ